MSRRRLLVCVCLILSVPLAGLLTFRLVVRQPRINRASYERIAFGMTAAEVEAILGVPPGNYVGDRGYGIRYRDVESKPATDIEEALRMARSTEHRWYGEEGAIIVWMDSRGVMVRKQFGDCFLVEESESFLVKLVRWFNW